MENLAILQEFLTDSQKSLFQESSFGPYLDMQPFKVPLQTIHSLLMYRVGSRYEEEICFKINDRFLRFSVEEFAIITGLDGWGDKFNVDFNPKVTPRLVKKYFPKQSASIHCPSRSRKHSSASRNPDAFRESSPRAR